MECDACGKNITDIDGTSISMFTFEIRTDTQEKEAFLKKQLGPYSLNVAFNFCCQCVIDRFLGVDTRTKQGG